MKKITSLLMVSVLALSLTGCAKNDYDAATALLAEGKYEEAKTAFEALGDYMDASDKVSSIEDSLLEEKIVGEWSYEHDQSESMKYMLSEMETEAADYIDIPSFICRYKLNFSENGDVTLSLDQETLEKTLEEYSGSLLAGFMDMYSDTIINELEANGITLEDALSYYGFSTKEEFIDEMTYENFGVSSYEYFSALIDTVIDSMRKLLVFAESSSTYFVENGRIFFNDGEDAVCMCSYDAEKDTITLRNGLIPLAQEDLYPMVFKR